MTTTTEPVNTKPVYKLTATTKGSHAIGTKIYAFAKGETLSIPSEKHYKIMQKLLAFRVIKKKK